ncbi:hypothetical protein AB0N17_34880 [Streptomyces sp. NPDC051133]|uniref:hypothetical protein n=1 Tax=Streptomyces sp. NPDC051133 TaxID=3155521 RepID=UPI00341A97DC
MQLIGRGAAAALMSAAALSLWAPAHAFADTPPATDKPRYCGSDKATGLAVWGDPGESCSTTLEVASAYTKAASAKGGVPATVPAGGTTWKCQERQGDPNPYLECVDSSDSSRRVLLSS